MITLTLEGQNLSVSTPHIVADTVDYLTISIVRGREWEKLQLHIFLQLGAKTYELVTDGEYIGTDAHINLTEGRWSVAVTGYAFEDDQMVMKITTNTIGLNVAAPPPDAGSDLPYTPPSAIEQIAAIAQSVRDDADSGAFDGKGISSVELNDDYTLTITFTDGTSETYGPIRGAQGEKGDPGAAGATGAIGAQGPQGERGPQGYQGIQGPQGVPGPTGATGNGISSVVMNDDYTLSIWFTDGTIYTTPSIRGQQGQQGEKGERGPRGYIGPEGPEGPEGPPGTTDYNDLSNKPTIPSTAADVSALPDTTTYAASPSVGGPATRTNAIHYAQVDNTSTATAFTVSIPGITSYYDGLTIMLKNGVVTSAANFTINVNNLGAKGAYNNMAAATRESTLFNVNYTMLFTYDSTRVEGGCWVMYRGYNSDNNTIGYQLRTNSTVLPTSNKTRYYRLLFTAADGKKWVPANTGYDNSATSAKTVNTNKIDPFGRIVYLGNSTNYNANADIPATATWQQYVLSLGYSFNRTGSALTLTTKTPVYVKCAPQTDGSVIMDSTTPIVQALPSTDDGKVYIFLGIAYSATNIELTLEHPVYYYKDGMIRLWTNQAPGLPAVSAADNGKILQVVNGAWAAATLNTYNGGVS